jgi:metallophosphoesterase (TIGR00282 family)
MRLLFCGDIVGRSGREAVSEHLPRLRRDLDLDFVVANIENAAHGFGVNQKVCEEMFAAGVDALTGGNHSWDRREVIGYIEKERRLLRPHNFPAGTPGSGAVVFPTTRGGKVLVLNVMGRLFMDPLDDPFACIERELSRYRLGATVNAVILDVHAEATSEKMAMGHVFDGRVSLVVGTHTHVPTADHRILPGGTAYQTDAGMCGDYDSVIGMEKAEPINRFTSKISSGRLSVADGPGALAAVYVETDRMTGLATRIAPVRLGAHLQETVPLRERVAAG